MSLSLLKIVSIILILLSTIAAAWYPFKKRMRSAEGYEFPIFEALAAGIFLGVGLIHMLGDADAGFINNGIHYPVAYVLAGAVFLLLLFLEHLGQELHSDNSGTGWVLLAVTILSIHSLLAGAALGMSLSLSTTIMVLIAILAHKWAASFALAVEINKSNLSSQKGLIFFIIFAVMTPVGIIIGDSLSFLSAANAWWQPVFMSLAAGTFLYIGTLHGLSRAVMVHRCCNIKEFFYVILGFTIMAIVAIWS